MADHLTEDTLQEIIEVFRQVDQTGNGFIRTADLPRVAASLGIGLSAAEIDDLQDQFGGEVSLQDTCGFLAPYIVNLCGSTDFEECFRAAARGNRDVPDGMIRAADVYPTVLQMGERLTEQELDETMRDIVIQPGGLIDLEHMLRRFTAM